MTGICVDAVNPAGCPDPSTLVDLGVTWVRVVAHATPAYYNYVANCHARGLKVACVLARESFTNGHYWPGRIHVYVRHAPCDLWILGNEPDAYLLGVPSPASWVMRPARYSTWAMRVRDDIATSYVNIFNKPAPTIIGGGLVSGQPGYIQACKRAGLYLDGWDIHPYGKTAGETAILLDAYRSIAMRPLYVMEWNRPAGEIAAYQASLDAYTVASAYFCWSDGMVPGFGLVDADGQPKDTYHALFGV